MYRKLPQTEVLFFVRTFWLPPWGKFENWSSDIRTCWICVLVTEAFLLPDLVFGTIYQWCSEPWMLFLTVLNVNLRGFCFPWSYQALAPNDCYSASPPPGNCLIKGMYLCITIQYRERHSYSTDTVSYIVN